PVVTNTLTRARRRARGIYYTPAHLIDYLVPRTVGRLLHDPGVPLRILDPACGAGDFLVRAYRYLLAWHRAHYSANAPTYADRLIDSAVGRQLTTAEKQRILLDSIFGVDIDPQAVATTRKALLQMAAGRCNPEASVLSTQYSVLRTLPSRSR